MLFNSILFVQIIQVVKCSDGILRLLFNSSYSFAHEGPVYHQKSRSIFFTSNRLILHDKLHVEVNRLHISASLSQSYIEFDISNDIPMANGACLSPYDTILICAQGNSTHPAGIYELNITSYKVEPILTSYHGLPFNSPNDIIIKDGYVWFTDPSYGYEQGFRPSPKEYYQTR